MSDDPARFEGHAVPFPSEVLSNLRKYIVNALQDSSRRTIPAHNKRWLLCLGDPCTELLEYIGFVRKVGHGHASETSLLIYPLGR